MTLSKAYKLLKLAIKDKKVKIHDFRDNDIAFHV